MKGKKAVASLTSAERGCLNTVLTCMNAAGHCLPPLVVFPRKNMQIELTDGTHQGGCHVSGWIQTHIFTQWFRHFISVTKPTVDDLVFLILDGHYSHTRNLDVITLVRENNVYILCLPPHNSHKKQPLDLAFMKPLKTCCSQEIESWLLNNFPRIVTIRKVGKLFRNAYLRTATFETAVNGFRKNGIYHWAGTCWGIMILQFVLKRMQIPNRVVMNQPCSETNSQLLLNRDSLAIFN
jgi:hypothetical protein